MDNNQPSVSVIIPVYNTAKWLPECLESILNQTKKDIEVICVDDCSTDPACRELILDYQRRDSRIVPLFLDKNGKQGIARNRGMEIAKGKYVYFLDSDDYVLPETLETAYAAAEENTLDVLFFNYDNIFDESLQNQKVWHGRPADGTEFSGTVMTGEKLLEEFYDHNAWICYVQRQFWRTEYLRKNEIRFLYCEHEDEFFSLTGIILAGRAMYIPDRMFIRRFRADSVMTRQVGPTNVHGYLVNVMHLVRFGRERGIESGIYRKAVGNLARLFVTRYNVLEDKTLLNGWFRDPDERDFFEFALLIWNVEETRMCVSCRKFRKSLTPVLKLRNRIFDPLRRLRFSVLRKRKPT